MLTDVLRYGAATRIIHRANDYYGRRPDIMRRASIMYSHTFSATVCLPCPTHDNELTMG
jgi:hypothetical protein